jgi:uncharacterized protein involved in outer membrane biogenesis
MIPALRLPRPGTKTRILLGLIIAIAIVAALFDWNWFRRPLEQYLIDRSHREVRIGELHVNFHWSLVPTVRVRDVFIENAPWADKRAAAIVGEASFTFSLKSLWEGQPVISRLVLIDADIDMERQADGLRNWRLRDPEYRGPGKVRVMRLEAQRTRIRFVRRDVDFEIVAASTPMDPTTKTDDATLSTRIAFVGEYRGVKFSGEALAGERLTLLGTREFFPLRGHMVSGKSRFDIDGSIADLFMPSATDAKVRLAGPSLSELGPVMSVALPASRPYEVEARLRQTKDEYSLTGLRGKIGGTDFSGKVSFDRTGKRPMVNAELRSESADLSDLRALSGRRKAAGSTTSTAATGAPGDAVSRAEEEPVRSGRIFPSGVINLEKLGALDAHVSVEAGKVIGSNLPTLENLRFSAKLENGILTLKPIHAGLAGGQVTGWFTLDGQKQPAAVQAKLEFQDIRLEKLLTMLPNARFSSGSVAASLDLRGHGTSVATILGAASGTLALTMEGGRISNLLDAKLGLNAGKVLRLLVGGDRSIVINSADVAFDFDNGSGTSKNIFLDTAQTRVVGTGSISLRDETVDLLLTPDPKKPGFFSLRSSLIHVDGSFRHLQWAIVKKDKNSDMAAGRK